MTSLAILLLVRQQTGSFASAGLAVGAFTLCGAAATPVQGRLVDRGGRGSLILWLACLEAVALSALVVVCEDHAPTGVIAGTAGVAGALVPPVDAYVRVLWPSVTPNAQMLEVAYQLDATTQEVIWTLGPLVVATMAGLFSPAAAVLATIAIGVTGTVLFLRAPLSRRPARTGAPTRAAGALRNPGLRLLIGTSVLMGFGIGAVEVGLPALAVHEHTRGSAGLLLALWSIGSMLGGVLYGTRAWRMPIRTRYVVLLALVAVCTAPLTAAGSLATAIPLSVLAGLGYAPMLSCEYALVASVAPAGRTTEAFAWVSSGLVAGLAVGAAVSGALVQSTGVHPTFALGAAATAGAALWAAAGRRWLAPGGEPSARSAPA